MPSRTRENTVTGLLTDYLRQNGLEALSPVGLEIPGEWPKEPDFEIKNRGVFVGEAKWESDFFQAIAEAHDYGRAPTVNGTIAIGYPEQLKNKIDQAELLSDAVPDVLAEHRFRVAFLRRDAATDLARLQIHEIPDWISSHIHREREPHPDPDEVVTVLRQTARALTEELGDLEAPDLFRNVLGVEPEESEEAEAAKRAAGYLLVNQITFYRVLSAVEPRYTTLDPENIDSPKDFQSYFDRVLEDDYAAIFSFSVADYYGEHHIGLLRSAVKSIYGLAPEQINHEVLGTVFHELTPISVRKPLAAYYTKHRSAEILATLSITDASATVLDPACGTGQLLSAAYRRKRELTTDFNEATHQRFLESEITGIDIMPFAAHLSTIHLALEQPAYQTNQVRIGIADSTRLRPGETLAPLDFVLPESMKGQTDLFEPQSDVDKWVEAGSISPEGMAQKGIELEKVDVVIMNPPYSRQESVSTFGTDYKDRLVERLGLYERYIHRKMSYCSYFLLLADRFIDDGNHLAAVLPASFLTKSSDRKVRQFLLEEYDIQFLCARRDSANFSEDTQLREILLVARKGASDSAAKYIGLENLDVDPDEVSLVARSADGPLVDAGNFSVITVPHNALGVHNLFGPFAVNNPELLEVADSVYSSPRLTKLGDIGAGLIGGVGSGGKGIDPESKDKDWQEGVINARDVQGLREHDIWIYESEDSDTVTAEHRQISVKVTFQKSHLVPDFRRTPNRAELNVSGYPEYALIEPPEDEEFFKYTEFEHLPRNWKSEVTRRLGRLALLRRVNLTAPGTRHLAYYSDEKRAFHGTLWVATSLTKEQAKILSMWFDSSYHLLQLLLNRTPGEGGYTEYHKYAVEDFEVLDLEQLRPEVLESLLGAFDYASTVEFPPLFEQFALNTPEKMITSQDMQRLEKAYPGLGSDIGDNFAARRAVDTAIGEVLPIDAANLQEYLDEFYYNLLMELVSLKLIMK